LAKVQNAEPDTDIVQRLVKVETRTSDFDRTLKGVEKTIITHGQHIATMVERLSWVAKALRVVAGLLVAIAVMCIGIIGMQMEGCVQSHSVGPTAAVAVSATIDK